MKRSSQCGNFFKCKAQILSPRRLPWTCLTHVLVQGDQGKQQQYTGEQNLGMSRCPRQTHPWTVAFSAPALVKGHTLRPKRDRHRLIRSSPPEQCHHDARFQRAELTRPGSQRQGDAPPPRSLLPPSPAPPLPPRRPGPQPSLCAAHRGWLWC